MAEALSPIRLCPQCFARLTPRFEAVHLVRLTVPASSHPIVQTQDVAQCLLEPEHTADWNEVFRRVRLKAQVSQWERAW
jgi:hypothetical protein